MLLAVLETNLRLGGVHVHVGEFGGHFQEQVGDGLAADHDQATVGLGQRVAE